MEVDEATIVYKNMKTNARKCSLLAPPMKKANFSCDLCEFITTCPSTFQSHTRSSHFNDEMANIAVNEAKPSESLDTKRLMKRFREANTQSSVIQANFDFFGVDLLFLYYLVKYQQKKLKSKRKYWVNPMNSGRLLTGQFYVKHPQLQQSPEKFLEYYGMSKSSFEELLCKVKPQLIRKDTNMRSAIPPEEMLSLTLRVQNDENEQIINSECNVNEFVPEHPTDIEEAFAQQKIYKCHICAHSTNCQSSLKNHIANLHSTKQRSKVDRSKDKKRKCNLCDYRTAFPSALKKHIDSIHLNVKDYKCEQCNYRARKASEVQRHIRVIHLKLKTFKCEFCEFCTSEKPYLKRHIDNAHINIKQYKCTLCRHTTSLKPSLAKHMRTVHSNKEVKKDGELKTDHDEKPTKQHQCQYCDFSTKTKKYLRSHIQHMHETSKNYKCNHCEYSAPRQSTIKNHIEAVHLKLKKHMCQFCDFRSSRTSHLRSHIKSMHLKNRYPDCPPVTEEGRNNSSNLLGTHNSDQKINE